MKEVRSGLIMIIFLKVKCSCELQQGVSRGRRSAGLSKLLMKDDSYQKQQTTELGHRLGDCHQIETEFQKF